MAFRPASAPRASQLTRRRVAIAAALWVSLSPAWAQFSSSGLNNVFPGNAAVPGGAGFRDLGNVDVYIGNGGVGSFSAMAGSPLRVGSFSIGNSGPGVGSGSLVLDGADTKALLIGDGISQGVGNRLEIGNWGKGSLTVSGGAALDGRTEIAPCQIQFRSCATFVGNGAGSDGLFTITGTGFQASILGYFAIGSVEVFHPPTDQFTFGTPAGTTRGRVEVLNGGKLANDSADIGIAPGGSSPTGTERSIAEVAIDGQAVSTLANSRNTSLYIGGNSGTAVGGKGIATVSGLGSEIRLTGSDSILAIGRGPQANGQLTVSNQATASAMGLLMGAAGGTGVLKLDNGVLNFSGQQTGDQLSGAFAVIGAGGGIGVATMSNGSAINISNMGASGASMNLGGISIRPLGDGSLTMTGGSSINIQAAPGLAALTVSRDGSALMRVRGASIVNVGDGKIYVARFKGSAGTLLVSEGSPVTAAGLASAATRRLPAAKTAAPAR